MKKKNKNKKYCKECGAEIVHGVHYCTTCGVNLKPFIPKNSTKKNEIRNKKIKTNLQFFLTKIPKKTSTSGDPNICLECELERNKYSFICPHLGAKQPSYFLNNSPVQNARNMSETTKNKSIKTKPKKNNGNSLRKIHFIGLSIEIFSVYPPIGLLLLIFLHCCLFSK